MDINALRRATNPEFSAMYEDLLTYLRHYAARPFTRESIDAEYDDAEYDVTSNVNVDDTVRVLRHAEDNMDVMSGFFDWCADRGFTPGWLNIPETAGVLRQWLFPEVWRAVAEDGFDDNFTY